MTTFVDKSANLDSPEPVTTDSAGNVYVADRARIIKITPAGAISTLVSGAPGALATDSAGNVYAANYSNIVKITPDGTVMNLAGKAGASGNADGTGSAARFDYLVGIAVDGSGNVYSAENGNSVIRKITPDGVVTTLAGSHADFGYADGTGSNARFFQLNGLCMDSSGNVYVTDQVTNTIRKCTPAGVVTTVAGNGFDESGYVDGPGTKARFNSPKGITIDSLGNLYVADYGNDVIRMISTAGIVSTIAGSRNMTGYVDAAGSDARFSVINGITVDLNGNFYITEAGNNVVRKGVLTLLPPPTVSSISVAPSSVVGQFLVTISRTNFKTDATALFGSMSALSVVVSDANTITCIAPATVGIVDVVVVNSDEQSGTLTNGFTGTGVSVPGTLKYTDAYKSVAKNFQVIDSGPIWAPFATSTISIDSKITLPSEAPFTEDTVFSLTLGDYSFSDNLGHAAVDGKFSPGKSATFNIIAAYQPSGVPIFGKEVKVGSIALKLSKDILTVKLIFKGSDNTTGAVNLVLGDYLDRTTTLNTTTKATITLGNNVAVFNNLTVTGSTQFTPAQGVPNTKKSVPLAQGTAKGTGTAAAGQ